MTSTYFYMTHNDSLDFISFLIDRFEAEFVT